MVDQAQWIELIHAILKTCLECICKVLMATLKNKCISSATSVKEV